LGVVSARTGIVVVLQVQVVVVVQGTVPLSTGMFRPPAHDKTPVLCTWLGCDESRARYVRWQTPPGVPATNDIKKYLDQFVVVVETENDIFTGTLVVLVAEHVIVRSGYVDRLGVIRDAGSLSTNSRRNTVRCSHVPLARMAHSAHLPNPQALRGQRE
jgi:hypothetical protein